MSFNLYFKSALASLKAHIRIELQTGNIQLYAPIRSTQYKLIYRVFSLIDSLLNNLYICCIVKYL